MFETLYNYFDAYATAIAAEYMHEFFTSRGLPVPDVPVNIKINRNFTVPAPAAVITTADLAEDNSASSITDTETGKKPAKLRCCAKIGNGNRCSRSANLTEFCKLHEKKNTRGRYDADIGNSENYTRIDEQFDTRYYIYIDTVKIYGDTYYRDENNLLYNMEAKIIGRLIDEVNVEWFT